MQWHKDILEYHTQGKGMLKITPDVEVLVKKWEVTEGMCFLYIPHASASLAISEGYDPSSRMDVENFFELLVPEDQPWIQHTLEGTDDSPSHIRSVLTQTSLSIPIDNGRLALGTWQSIFLFEHRARHQVRQVIVRFLKVS